MVVDCVGTYKIACSGNYLSYNQQEKCPVLPFMPVFFINKNEQGGKGDEQCADVKFQNIIHKNIITDKFE